MTSTPSPVLLAGKQRGRPGNTSPRFHGTHFQRSQIGASHFQRPPCLGSAYVRARPTQQQGLLTVHVTVVQNYPCKRPAPHTPQASTMTISTPSGR